MRIPGALLLSLHPFPYSQVGFTPSKLLTQRLFTVIFRPPYQLSQSAAWTNISLCKEYAAVLSRSGVHTLLWPRAWYACSGYHPSYHVSQKLLAKILFQEPAPQLLLGHDMAQIHSNLQCNEFLSHMPFLHIFEYPIWLQFLAPDLQRHSYLKLPPYSISAHFLVRNHFVETLSHCLQNWL